MEHAVDTRSLGSPDPRWQRFAEHVVPVHDQKLTVDRGRGLKHDVLEPQLLAQLGIHDRDVP